MKATIISTILAAAALAQPVQRACNATTQAEDTQLSITRTDLEDGNASKCPDLILVYARGSLEKGNLGTLGPSIAYALEANYGKSNIWVQGVGSPYNATLADNFLPRGTTPEAIDEMVRLFELADTKCPAATVLSGGYSQGAALAAAAITDFENREKIAGTILFGYTRNKQNGGGIPKYPAQKTKVFCNEGDLVCDGILKVEAPHLDYAKAAATEGPKFLIQSADAPPQYDE